MFLRNDYRRELRNGSLGTVAAVISEDALVVDFDGTVYELAGRGLDNLVLAYAVTVHMAQGSAFRRVVMPVVRTRLLDRSLVYTAVTRAREQVVLIGERGVTASAVVAEASAHRRETSLRLALRGHLPPRPGG
ncbi:ATP-binding domain-containing protein [Microvirga thermotolerans]|uniref:UvrD-like helicase C-terminal domain-containing protein n=1 Tax=Microvirga thermotolerans TaxID=2651334 RepID=A0A5P9JXL4_9HYPH|nr:ATP-binding domain-containing protein [Microvirga thermotolerans]QFU16871.1 hypothetical protein GDR74_11890 [Microvirga thermotolerans]